MAATTDLQKSADADVRSLEGLAWLAHCLDAPELGGDSLGPAVLDLGHHSREWQAMLDRVRDEYGQELMAMLDQAASAYMAAETQRSFLRALVHGRAFTAGEVRDDAEVSAIVDALIAQAPRLA